MPLTSLSIPPDTCSTVRKLAAGDQSSDDSESDVEVIEQPNEINDKLHSEVLEGVEVTPLKQGITGAAEGATFGYQSKLISNWYEHKCQTRSCPDRWSEFDNVDDDGVDLKHRTSQIPIVHRHVYVKKHWVTDSVTFQDPAMRKVLAEVLRKYQDLDCELENWTFEPPFMPLVHRWDVLKKYHDTAETGELKNASSALLAFLTPILASSIISLAQTKKTGKVNFQNIWQIFPPSSLVMTKFYGVETICRVLKYKRRPADMCNPEGWIIDMEYVDWNGENCGYANTTLTIWEFEGFRRVTSLPVFPISFLSDIEGTKAKMLERGRRFERLRGYHFMVCNGTKVLLETEKPEQRPVGTLIASLWSIRRLTWSYRWLEECAWMPMLITAAATLSSLACDHCTNRSMETLVKPAAMIPTCRIRPTRRTSR